MPTVKELLRLDAILSLTAAQRDVPGADFDKLEEEWHRYDDRRQALMAAATDRELISYEIHRHKIQELLKSV